MPLVHLRLGFVGHSTYRQQVSTQLALMDSQRLIRQGRTIQRLTYLTIAYLPFGLAAVRYRYLQFVNFANAFPRPYSQFQIHNKWYKITWVGDGMSAVVSL